MKRVCFAMLFGLLLAACAEQDTVSPTAEQDATPAPGQETRALSNAGTPESSTTPLTTQPAGPETGVGAGATASSGIGTASAAGASANESREAESGQVSPAEPATNTAPSNPPLPE